MCSSPDIQVLDRWQSHLLCSSKRKYFAYLFLPVAALLHSWQQQKLSSRCALPSLILRRRAGFWLAGFGCLPMLPLPLVSSCGVVVLADNLLVLLLLLLLIWSRSYCCVVGHASYPGSPLQLAWPCRPEGEGHLGIGHGRGGGGMLGAPAG